MPSSRSRSQTGKSFRNEFSFLPVNLTPLLSGFRRPWVLEEEFAQLVHFVQPCQRKVSIGRSGNRTTGSRLGGPEARCRSRTRDR